MKHSVTKLFILIIISCNNKSKNDVYIEKIGLDSQQNISIVENLPNQDKQIEIDTTKLLRPDFFELPQEAYEKYESGKTANWFISENKLSKLYIIPYTDGSLTTAVLTEDKIPDSNLLNMIVAEGAKIMDVENAIKVTNLISKKGISIGLDKEKVVSILGKNYQEINKSSSIVILTWESGMKENPKDVNGGFRPFIMNGLNHKSIAYFNKNKLTAIIYTYEVP